MNKSQQAINYMNTGHTCCEAVLYAYRQQTGLDEKMVNAIGAGFGSGMGGRQATCGALIGAVIVCFLSSKNPHFHQDNSPSSSWGNPHFQRGHQDADFIAASCRMSACSIR